MRGEVEPLWCGWGCGFGLIMGFGGLLRCAAEAVAVFCDCATSDVVAFLVEFSTYEVVA